MVCLLEIRQLNGAPPSFRQIFIRSAPVFILAVVWHFPTDVLPQWAIAGWTFVFLALVLANLVNGVLGVIKGVSLLDRLTQTVVLQVKVPPHAVPNVVGTRLF